MAKSATNEADLSHSRFAQVLSRVLFAAAVAFSALVRFRLLAMPLERDEGEYAYAGQFLLKGIPFYRWAYSMKLPGASFMYAAAMRCFGQDERGIHLGLLIANVVTIVLLYFLVRDVISPLAAGFSALSFSMMSAGQCVLGLAAHATHFIALFGVAGAWVLWRSLRSEKAAAFFWSGLLFGLAFLMKQQGLFFPASGVVAAAIFALNRRPLSWRMALVPPGILALGAALPFALTCLWLWITGDFGRFWFWTFQYARVYASEVGSFGEALHYFLDTFSQIVKPQWPFWPLAVGGALALALSRPWRTEVCYALGFALASFLSICPGFYFRNQYFLALLPAVALLCGAGCEKTVHLASRLGQRPGGRSPSEAPPTPRLPKGAADRPSLPSRSAATVAVAVLLAAFAAVLYGARDFWFIASPAEACRATYGQNPFAEAVAIASFIREHSRPEQKIAILGSEPEILFYCGRLSATGFIYTYSLMEPQPFARSMQTEMSHEIEEAKPEFIVSVRVQSSWLRHPESCNDIFNWADAYVASHYTPVGLVDIQSRSTQYTWDEAALDAQPLGENFIWVMKRKP